MANKSLYLALPLLLLYIEHNVLTSSLIVCDGDTESLLCSIQPSNQCTAYTDSSTDITYDCMVGQEGCVCVDTEISTSVVFLIDATGVDELDTSQFFSNDDLWNYVITYWPEAYATLVGAKQIESGNIDYTWVLFGSDVYQTGTYDVSGMSFPWDGITSLPSELAAQRDSVNFCNAFNEALTIFDNDGRVSRTIVYVAFNDPAIYECDLPDYAVNFMLILWGAPDEIDVNRNVRNYFSNIGGGDSICYYQEQDPESDNAQLIPSVRQYSPTSDLESDSLFREWHPPTSDFVCLNGNLPTEAPTARPSASPVVDPTPEPTPNPTPIPTPNPTPEPTVGEVTPGPTDEAPKGWWTETKGSSGKWWNTYQNDDSYYQGFNNWNRWNYGSSSSSSSSSRWSSSSDRWRYGGYGKYGNGYGWTKPNYGSNGYTSGYGWNK